jgi:hypothetical protein
MKNKFLVIAMLFIFLGYTKAFAETTIKAEVDKLNISTDESITYKLIITSSENKTPEPQVPDFANFAVISQAQSSTISFIKGGIKSIQVYVYILTPLKPGKFKIAPSQIKIKNKPYASQEFEINVTQGKIKSQPKSEEKPSLPEGIETDTGQPQVTL